MRILYVGLLWVGGTCRQRMVALQDLGHDVVGIDTTPTEAGAMSRFSARVLSRLGYPPDTVGANHQIRHHLERGDFDILWVDRGLSVNSGSLTWVKWRHPQCRLVSYSPDDMLNPRNQSRAYLGSVPHYDVHITTKSYNVSELKRLGAREVLFIGNAFDPHTHRPMTLTPAERAQWGAETGFIGQFERERHAMILALAEAGLQIVVCGPGWRPYAGQHPKLVVKSEWVLADDYARAICATKVNLCFLRKANRDLQTTRSVEIPACGAFMLAERTSEHLELFQEDSEAVFFSLEDELIHKTQYYLAHDAERERIAIAGRERCLSSGYSNQERLSQAISFVVAAGKRDR